MIDAMPVMPREPSSIVDDAFTSRVLACGIKVHRFTGPGLLESAYETFFTHELSKSGFSVARGVSLPAVYDGVRFDEAYKPDLIIDGRLIVELKAVSQLLPIHDAQLITYLRLSGISVGLLMNFHSQPLMRGVKRLVVNHP